MKKEIKLILTANTNVVKASPIFTFFTGLLLTTTVLVILIILLASLGFWIYLWIRLSLLLEHPIISTGMISPLILWFLIHYTTKIEKEYRSLRRKNDIE